MAVSVNLDKILDEAYESSSLAQLVVVPMSVVDAAWRLEK